MCDKCEAAAAGMTRVEQLALRNLSRDLSQVMIRAVAAAGLQPKNELDFCAVVAAARAVAAALEATMGPAMLERSKELAEELAAERLAAVGFSSAGSH